MKDTPIIFSGLMVRALLDGRKTMTRRLAWRKPFAASDEAVRLDNCWKHIGDGFYCRPSAWHRVKPGDRLWVRESIARPFAPTSKASVGHDAGFIYRADGPEYLSRAAADHQWGAEEKWTPSIHCPRIASRITLIVTATKIEPLQAIRETECIAEGCEVIKLDGNPVDDGPMVRLERPHVYGTPRTWFRELWDTLHGTGAWDGNPDVVAVTYTVHAVNIDQMKAAA